MSLPVKCPLCKATHEYQSVVTSHVYGSKYGRGRAFYHCNQCDIRYQHPGLSPNEERHFYAAEFEAFMASRSGASGGWQQSERHILANEPTRQRRMKYLEAYLQDGSRVLEVGCSSGFMLFPLVERGLDCTGVEPSGVFSESVKDHGIEVFGSLSELNECKPNALFDLILHFFVLEHIGDPEEFLNSQLELLKPGGRIIFEIPNAADPLFSVYDIHAFERFYWSVAHPWYFSESSLQYLLNRLGHPFSIQREQRYDFSNHMIWARDEKPGGLGAFSSLLGADFDDFYKKTLIKIGRCDTLIGIITKV